MFTVKGRITKPPAMNKPSPPSASGQKAPPAHRQSDPSITCVEKNAEQVQVRPESQGGSHDSPRANTHDDDAQLLLSTLSLHPSATVQSSLPLPPWSDYIIPLTTSLLDIGSATEANAIPPGTKRVLVLLWLLGIFLSENQCVSLVSSSVEVAFVELKRHADNIQPQEGDDSPASSMDLLLDCEDVIRALAKGITDSRATLSKFLHDNPSSEIAQLPDKIKDYLRAFKSDADEEKDDTGRLAAISAAFGVDEIYSEQVSRTISTHELEAREDALENLDESASEDETLYDYEEGTWSFDVLDNPQALLRPHGIVLRPKTELTRFLTGLFVDDFGLGAYTSEGGKVDCDTRLWVADLG